MCDISGTRDGLQGQAVSADLEHRGQWSAEEWVLPHLSKHLGRQGSRAGNPSDPTPLMRLVCPQSIGGCPLDEALYSHP